jgi:hypothetical protein
MERQKGGLCRLFMGFHLHEFLKLNQDDDDDDDDEGCGWLREIAVDHSKIEI